MRQPLLVLIQLGLIALFACGPSKPAPTGPEIAARDFIVAWCREDGSHTEFEFARDQLPAAFFEHSETRMDFARGVPVARVDFERTVYLGPGEVPELGQGQVHFVDVLGREQTVSCLRLQAQVMFANGSIFHAIVAVRPDVPFVADVVTDVTLAQRWLVIPPKAKTDSK